MFKSVAVALAALGVLSYCPSRGNGFGLRGGNDFGLNNLVYRGPVAGLTTGVGAVALDANDINKIENMRLTNAIDRTVGGTYAGQALLNDVNRIGSAAGFENGRVLNGNFDRFGNGINGLGRNGLNNRFC